MINQSNLKGKALVDTILSHLNSLNLPLEKVLVKAIMERVLCPGRKGVQVIVKESCPLAVYVYYSAHVLNLVLVKSDAVPKIHNTYDFTWDIASFF